MTNLFAQPDLTTATRQRSPRGVLTDRAIGAKRPGPKDIKLVDGNGLYLLIKPTEKKLWHWRYSILRKEKLMALGPYPEVTLSEARSQRDLARKAVVAGTDPMALRKSNSQSCRLRNYRYTPTFG